MVGLFFITFSNMDKLINLYGALFVLMVALSLNGCSAYFDEDGLSISPEDYSYKDIRGCYYYVYSRHGYETRDLIGLYNVECEKMCIEDSVAFYYKTKFYTDSSYSKIDLTFLPESEEWVKSVRLLHPTEHNGSFLYNLQIGSKPYVFEKDNDKSIYSDYKTDKDRRLLFSDDINQVGDSLCVEYWR